MSCYSLIVMCARRLASVRHRVSSRAIKDCLCLISRLSSNDESDTGMICRQVQPVNVGPYYEQSPRTSSMFSTLMYALEFSSAEISAMRLSEEDRSSQKWASASIASPMVGTVAVRILRQVDRLEGKRHLPKKRDVRSSLGVVTMGERTSVMSGSTSTSVVLR